jgi:hypothetical protein
MNKTGDFQEHALGIIVGVVCLSLLLFAGWKFWEVSNVSAHEKAVEALETIALKLKAIEDGESTRFPLQGPKGWYVQGWGVRETGRPERCYFKSCICACRALGAESCQDTKSGTCIFVEENNLFVGVEAYRLEKGAFAGENPSAWTKSKELERCPRIVFPGNLLEVTLQKKRGSVELMSASNEVLDFSQECSR